MLNGELILRFSAGTRFIRHLRIGRRTRTRTRTRRIVPKGRITNYLAAILLLAKNSELAGCKMQ